VIFLAGYGHPLDGINEFLVIPPGKPLTGSPETDFSYAIMITDHDLRSARSGIDRLPCGHLNLPTEGARLAAPRLISLQKFSEMSNRGTSENPDFTGILAIYRIAMRSHIMWARHE
jgi:hypothetical protein